MEKIDTFQENTSLGVNFGYCVYGWVYIMKNIDKI